ncbi:MAG TPA: hypothetical protein VFR23_23955 [Jiangellaceae bacterium]|nr:hypothetical protein [Jiangellaceae bacterium]
MRGASPWRRGVRADEQVLVCPDCQQNPSWLDDIDRCAVCGSTALFRRLGTTVCRDCEARRLGRAGGQWMASAGAPARPSGDPAEAAAQHGEEASSESGAVDMERDLAGEVAAAIDRVLGRI